jgi:hypothetical protein
MRKLPAGVDSRSKLARQYRQAVRDLAAEIGGEDALSVAERELIEQAAVLMALSASMRTDVLRGNAVDSVEITRLANSSATLIAAVTKQRSKRKPEFIPLRERLKQSS